METTSAMSSFIFILRWSVDGVAQPRESEKEAQGEGGTQTVIVGSSGFGA
jgi:hypothetical protein